MVLDQFEEQDKKTSFDLSFAFLKTPTPVDHKPKYKMYDYTEEELFGLGLRAEFLGSIPDTDLEEDKLVNWISPE